ncbi:ATP-binding cassette domain-containing protein [Microbacterium gorillae]|uniref:ATP-binding cassette domain-containing protein n=1 Tax=Microbacterium gorillae TaxID=1231063 RepID=UPI000A6EEF3E|nr:ATP-binding cassette domain-containing protein [Microbacterium gorillae]
MSVEMTDRERSRTADADAPPLLELRGASKAYGNVQALTDVDFTVRAGEVVALLGDNGAGKSTLVKAIAGANQLTSGEMLIAGSPTTISSPAEASRHGIETVYQDLALCDNLDVTANLYLGRELRVRSLGMMDQIAMEKSAQAVIADLAATIPSLDRLVSGLSGGQRQAVAVARAALWGSRVVLLDEPTAALGVAQTHMVYELVRKLRDRGIGVVVVTHNMADAFAIADRITVLRLGRNAGEFSPLRNTPEQVVAAITGADTLNGGHGR